MSAFLARLGPLAPMRLASPARVAYQDACHLAHAQSVRREPRDLLARIEGLELVELVDGDICCGSAGIYNLEQPDIARTLGARKAATVVATQASVVVTGNVGCQMQLRAHLRESGSPVEVLHTVEVLARALETRPSRGA